MPSKAEQIATAAEGALKGATPFSVPVYRDREVAFARDEPEAILLELGDEETDAWGGGQRTAMPGARMLERDALRLTVTAVIRGAAWQQRADAIRVAAHAALVSSTALRGLVVDLRRERAEWKPSNADQPFGYLAQTYVVTYLTASHALDAAT